MSVDSHPPLQHEAEHVTIRRRPHVFGYLAVLFAAALLLLGMSYLMQRRDSEAAIAGLTESLSSMQSAEALRAENEALQGENEALWAENDALRAENAVLQEKNGVFHTYILALLNELERMDLAARAPDERPPALQLLIELGLIDLDTVGGYTGITDFEVSP